MPPGLVAEVDDAIRTARWDRLWWKAAEEAAHYQQALFDIASGTRDAQQVARDALRKWRAA